MTLRKTFQADEYFVFWKAMENLQKHRDIKLIATQKRRNYFVSQQNYHTTKLFHRKFIAIEMKKSQILMNKVVYLDLSKLDLSKNIRYEFWYEYAKTKYGEKEKLCYLVAGNFVVHIKTDDIYREIAVDVEVR